MSFYEENELQRLNEEAQQSQVVLDEQVEDSENSEELEEFDDEFADIGFVQMGIKPDLANKQLTYTDEHGITSKASDFLEVINVIKNLDTQRMKLTLHHVSACFDRELTINLESLKKTQLFSKLTSNGVLIYEGYTGPVGYYLMEQVDAFQRVNQLQFQHEKRGWADAYDKSKGFFASRSIGASYSSILRGNDDEILGPHGDKDIYKKMILEEVIPNKNLQIPFVLAFTAPIIPLMYDKSACPVLLTNFAGFSSKGKSTSLVLIASVWGRGIVANDRLSIVKTFASTQNGFQAAVNDTNGVPVLFDDYQTAPEGIAFGRLIYTLSSGESKIRCDKYGHTIETYQWRTTIALSGEASIFDRAGHDCGLKPRVVEFKNMTWTKSKMNSINITSTVATNYGFYGEEFVEGLLGLSKDELDAYYDSSNSVIESLLPSKDNIADRIQTRLVLIRMTAELVKNILGFDIDVDYITKFLVDNELARQKGPSVNEEAKEAISEYINANLSRFVRTDKKLDGTTLPNSNLVGRIYQDQDSYVAIILPDAFRKVMSAFNDREAIMKAWADEGFLLSTKGKEPRLEKKARLTSFTPPTWCYWFVFKDKKGKLYKKLAAKEEVSIQDLDDERRLKDFYHITKGVSDKVAVKDDKVGSVETIEKPIYLPRIGDNQPLQLPKKYEEVNSPVVDDTHYDDEQAINEIFKEEK